VDFLRHLALQKKKTWWQLASRCCWNRACPWHASELVCFLVGLRTYQHHGVWVYKLPTSSPASDMGLSLFWDLNGSDELPTLISPYWIAWREDVTLGCFETSVTMSCATCQNGQLRRVANLQSCNTFCINGGIRIHLIVCRFLLWVCTAFASQSRNMFIVHKRTYLESLFAACLSFHGTPWRRLSQCLLFKSWQKMCKILGGMGLGVETCKAGNLKHQFLTWSYPGT